MFAGRSPFTQALHRSPATEAILSHPSDRTSTFSSSSVTPHLKLPFRRRVRTTSCLGRRTLRRYRSSPVAAFDDDSAPISSFLDESDGIVGGKPYILSSSEGEESDTELLLMTPPADSESPATRDYLDTSESAITATANRIAILHRGGRKRRAIPGIIIYMCLLVLLSIFITVVDCCSWRIVRLPLPRFHLTLPFSISLVLSACAGYLCVPVFRAMKIYQIIGKEGPPLPFVKKGTPTMGGLFFIPIGIIVASTLVGFSSIEVHGAATVTLAFLAIGFLNDIVSLARTVNYGIPWFAKYILQAACGSLFSLWLNSADISSPYNMKFLVPLPQPFGLIYLGNLYLILTTVCLTSMGNVINLTDGLDRFAGGTAALALLGMSVAVLPLCPDLAVFGASMAGACLGFVFHNRCKTSVFMGDCGSLALGGALAAMAACTGMFFPLFVSYGVFVLEAVSIMIQVFFFKATKRMSGSGYRLFRLAPFGHHSELCGLKEPTIAVGACALSCIFSLCAAYIGLVSA